MSEDTNKQVNKENATVVKKNTDTANNQKSEGAAKVVAKSVYGEKKKQQRKERRGRNDKKKDEFDQRILDIARVTRVMAGGKRMNFRACVAIGDKKGKVATALGKGSDVSIAVNKAVNKAKKDMVTVSMVNDTIPHEVYSKVGAAKILFKPAKQGRGIIAGGVVRIILELAGVKNISSKILGTNNKINNARCTIEALRSLKNVEDKKQAPEKTKTADNKDSNENKDKKTDSNQSK
ncbi:MAG TPA: 30S ribosomal protein S5 [Patescibacteria group bacterium]|nr:30S ribosomal protein S5 [Patescibacteria group bacterium]